MEDKLQVHSFGTMGFVFEVLVKADALEKGDVMKDKYKNYFTVTDVDRDFTSAFVRMKDQSDNQGCIEFGKDDLVTVVRN